MIRITIPIHILLILVGTIIVLVLALWLGPMWRSLLIATLLAYLLNPLVKRLQRRLPVQRGLAVALVYTLFLLTVVGLLLLIGRFVWGQVPGWSQELGEALREMERSLERPFVLLGFRVQPQSVLAYLQRSAGNAVATFPLEASGLLGGITDNLLWTLVVLLSLYYLLRDGSQIAPAFVQLLPLAYQPDAALLFAELDQVWRIFLRVQLIIFAVIGVLIIASTTLILWLFRLGWLPLSPLGLVILLIVVYAGIQQIDNLWLRPQYMGQALKLHPGVVFVALVAALALTGVLGALVIIPILASLKVIGLYFHNQFLATPASNPS